MPQDLFVPVPSAAQVPAPGYCVVSADLRYAVLHSVEQSAALSFPSSLLFAMLFQHASSGDACAVQETTYPS